MKKERKEILIIDDNRESRELLKGILGNSYPVLLSRGAGEGLKKLSANIGLVFLDYMLPDSTGLEVLRQIKRTYSSLPVIFITGYGNEEICQKAFRAGARDYVKKPFDRDEICSKVDLLMRLHGDQEARSNALLYSEDAEMSFSKERRVPPRILDSILKVKDYLDQHYTQRLGLDEAVRMAGMSKPSFCAYFRYVTGYSLIDYSNYVRVERSKDLLRKMELPISEIAVVSGYNSVNYYIETFKKFHGSSPSEFRRKLQPQ